MAKTPSGYPFVRLHPSLVAYLLTREYRTNVRELEAVLWKALADSRGDVVELPEALRSGPRESSPGVVPPSNREEIRHVAERLAERLVLPQRAEPTADELRAALAQSNGSVAQAARALGLSSRYALYRLLRKHQITVAGGEHEGDGEPG